MCVLNTKVGTPLHRHGRFTLVFVVVVVVVDSVVVDAPFTFSTVTEGRYFFFCMPLLLYSLCFLLRCFLLGMVIGVGDNGRDLMEARCEIYKNDAFASCETSPIDNTCAIQRC